MDVAPTVNLATILTDAEASKDRVEAAIIISNSAMGSVVKSLTHWSNDKEVLAQSVKSLQLPTSITTTAQAALEEYSAQVATMVLGYLEMMQTYSNELVAMFGGNK